MLDINYAIL